MKIFSKINRKRRKYNSYRNSGSDLNEVLQLKSLLKT